MVILKNKFHQQKSPLSIKNIDINKIIVSNKVSIGQKDFKYFIGYKDAKKLKINTNFHNNKIPKESSQCMFTFLSVISIDSVFKTGKNYYPQVFLEECKYMAKEKKVSEYITDETEIASDDSDREEFGEENV